MLCATSYEVQRNGKREIYAVGMDYDGNFFVFSYKITNNPLLKLNMESIVC